MPEQRSDLHDGTLVPAGQFNREPDPRFIFVRDGTPCRLLGMIEEEQIGPQSSQEHPAACDDPANQAQLA
jgi:hypothetical protein